MPASNYEKTTSFAALLLLLFTCYQVLKPFLFDMLWAGILCFVTWPLYSRLRAWPLSSNAAASLMVLPIGLLLLLPLATATQNLSDDLTQILQWLQHPDTETLAAPAWLTHLPWLGDQAQENWYRLAHDSERLMQLLRQYALSTGSWMLKQSLNLAAELMHIGLSIVLLFFLYRDGERANHHLEIIMQQLAGPHSNRILEIIRSSLKAVVYGILGTALAQAIGAMLGLMITGVPHALILGIASFFLMIIPGAGIVLWLPVALWLLSQDEPGRALFIALWFVLFIGTLDNWLRPLLISREIALPFVLIMLGIFGGLMAFGLIGIFLGPTLLATSYALVIDWLIRKEQDSDDISTGKLS